MKKYSLISSIILFLMGYSTAWTSYLEEDTEGMNPACRAKVSTAPLATSLELSLRYDFMDQFEQFINFVSNPVRTAGQPYDLNQLKRALSERQALDAGIMPFDSIVPDEIDDGAHAAVIVGFEDSTSLFKFALPAQWRDAWELEDWRVEFLHWDVLPENIVDQSKTTFSLVETDLKNLD
jgi:hypothetical protein